MLSEADYLYSAAAQINIDRVRFWAGMLELQWLLRGLRDGMQDMLVVHIGRKRDVLPIGSGWV